MAQQETAFDTLESVIGEGRSTLVSRNITILGRRTSVRLEPEMWTALRDIAAREKCRIHDICSLIHLRKNQRTSLTAAIRVFLMLYYRASSTEEGHDRVGHGNFSTMMARARVTRQDMNAQTEANKRAAQSQPQSPAFIPVVVNNGIARGDGPAF